MNDNIYILIAAILSAVSPLLIDRYMKGGQRDVILLYISVISTVATLYFYAILCQRQNTSMMYTLIKILSILLVVVVGSFVFKEKLNCKNIVGVVLAIVAMVLLKN